MENVLEGGCLLLLLNGRVENEKWEKMNDEKGAKASMEGGERKTQGIIKNWKERNKKEHKKKKKNWVPQE